MDCWKVIIGNSHYKQLWVFLLANWNTEILNGDHWFLATAWHYTPFLGEYVINQEHTDHAIMACIAPGTTTYLILSILSP